MASRAHPARPRPRTAPPDIACRGRAGGGSPGNQAVGARASAESDRRAGHRLHGIPGHARPCRPSDRPARGGPPRRTFASGTIGGASHVRGRRARDPSGHRCRRRRTQPAPRVSNGHQSRIAMESDAARATNRQGRSDWPASHGARLPSHCGRHRRTPAVGRSPRENRPGPDGDRRAESARRPRKTGCRTRRAPGS